MSGIHLLIDSSIIAVILWQTDDNTIWVVSLFSGKLGVYAVQADNTLVLIDMIKIGTSS
jgi:hypothetical protein